MWTTDALPVVRRAPRVIDAVPVARGAKALTRRVFGRGEYLARHDARGAAPGTGRVAWPVMCSAPPFLRLGSRCTRRESPDAAGIRARRVFGASRGFLRAAGHGARRLASHVQRSPILRLGSRCTRRESPDAAGIRARRVFGASRGSRRSAGHGARHDARGAAPGTLRLTRLAEETPPAHERGRKRRPRPKPQRKRARATPPRAPRPPRRPRRPGCVRAAPAARAGPCAPRRWSGPPTAPPAQRQAPPSC